MAYFKRVTTEAPPRNRTPWSWEKTWLSIPKKVPPVT